MIPYEAALRERMVANLRSHDVLVHHPYESFATSVEAFVEQAARDPKVLAIKQTLYRTGGAESTIINGARVCAACGKSGIAKRINP